MPPTIRQLEQRLLKAGFVLSGGKGSHRKYTNPEGLIVIVSGRPGADAKHYQLRLVEQALRKVEQ